MNAIITVKKCENEKSKQLIVEKLFFGIPFFKSIRLVNSGNDTGASSVHSNAVNRQNEIQKLVVNIDSLAKHVVFVGTDESNQKEFEKQVTDSLLRAIKQAEEAL